MMVYVTSAGIICAVSLFLILHCGYEDGVFGRLALCVLALSSGLIVTDWMIDGSEYNILPNTLATQCAMALFLARHCYRFMRWRKYGTHDWRPK